MLESNTEFVDYYPEGWTEEIVDPERVEWHYEADETIAVRVAVEDSPPQYYVSAMTGVTDADEAFVAATATDLSATQAFDVAKALIYAMNGAIGRIQGEEEFGGSQS
ncbi:MAG: hypothetical protein ABEI77_02640 [Halorientalis sp.]